MGDVRIKRWMSTSLGDINPQAIDANRKKRGTFTERREVDSEVVYLTPEGAKVLDALPSWTTLTVGKDPSVLRRLIDPLLDLLNLTPGIPDEECKGKL
jgi:hypothetical protein